MTYTNNKFNTFSRGIAFGGSISPEIDRLEKIANGEFVESFDSCNFNLPYSSITLPRNISQESIVYKKQLQSILNKALESFNGRTKNILQMRFEEGLTYKLIAKKFKISQVRVLKILQKSLLKLKEILISQNLIIEF